MFNPSKSNAKLEKAMDELVVQLGDHPESSDEYGAILERMSKLHKIQEDRKPESISPNTALTVAANLIGIAVIVRHEHLNVITSKALSFVLRPR